MARKVERLDALTVKRLEKPGYHADGAGLYLQVSPTGSKSWVLRYALAGKEREMGLGSYTTFTLAEARQRAKAQRKRLADGIDPIEAKRASDLAQRLADANVITFDTAAAKFIKANASGWRNAKHGDQWRNTLETYASPIIGDVPVAGVSTAMVLRILTPIWETKTETATRVRGRIEKVLDWAKVQGYRTGDNPAAWRGHLSEALPKPSKVATIDHHAALPYLDVGAFMQVLRDKPGMAARALEFVILTACRTGEAIGATWGEIDLDAEIWTIPAARMKAGREHRVPLSDAAVKLLRDVNPGSPSEPVFAGPKGKPLSNMACLALLRRMGRDRITAHGFRSTFRDWCAEQTNYPRDVAEMALAHSIADKTEAAYRRGDLLEKRRALMSEWAAYCAAARVPGAVVPIRKNAAA